jgi:hypothetical protein
MPWYNLSQYTLTGLAETAVAALGRSRNMTHSTVAVPPELLAEFCQRWKIRELALFGSALRDDFRADSDIDLLVTLLTMRCGAC